MTVRSMTLDELHLVLGWAADEGWNPGLSDAEAFFAADPAGFLVKELGGTPVAAISVVNHDAAFSFLGLYLCKSAFRGQGHGMEVWRAGMSHAGARCIGLDGVPDQQANYALSGFTKCGSTIRFEGHIPAASDPRVRLAKRSDLPVLLDWDRVGSGMSREAFAKVWLSQTALRETHVIFDGTQVTGFATFRRCQTGSKIGPLYAACAEDALALMASNPFTVGSEPVFVDVQDHGSGFAALLRQRGFDPVFETARMFTGTSPKAIPTAFHAIATMELG